MKNNRSGGGVRSSSPKLIIIFSLFSFICGMLFTNRIWVPLESDGRIMRPTEQGLKLVADDCVTKKVFCCYSYYHGCKNPD
ncbi:putative glycosyl transferase, family 31 [Helianthus annuus]|nr:putative glycosyl transferase, family 31 [Helianthus annuus]